MIVFGATMLRKTFLSVSLASMISIIPATAEIEKPFLAIVNGEKIYESEIRKTHSELPQQYQQLPFDILKPMLLDRAINQQLLIISGKKANLENDKQVKKRIKILSDRVVAETFLERNISKKVNEKAIKEDYENFLKNSEPEPLVHARHILLKTKSDALSVIKELNNGENFIQLVKKRSIDKSNIEDGDLGFIENAAFAKDFTISLCLKKPRSPSSILDLSIDLFFTSWIKFSPLLSSLMTDKASDFVLSKICRACTKGSGSLFFKKFS
jgi:peptidyl-prolyl cis-trans isomerase C